MVHNNFKLESQMYLGRNDLNNYSKKEKQKTLSQSPTTGPSSCLRASAE